MQTYWALMERDLRVLGRNFLDFATRIIVQPFLLVFVYGYVLPGIGQIKPEYANILLPGVLASSMMMSGVQGTAIPLSQDFGQTREIEDRLMSPISTAALIAQKITMGALQAWIAALMVFPIACRQGMARSTVHAEDEICRAHERTGPFKIGEFAVGEKDRGTRPSEVVDSAQPLRRKRCARSKRDARPSRTIR